MSDEKPHGVHHCGICEKMPVGLATVAARLSAAGPPH